MDVAVEQAGERAHHADDHCRSDVVGCGLQERGTAAAAAQAN
jgi:hypothetical protein